MSKTGKMATLWLATQEVIAIKKEYPGSWHHRKDGRRNSGAYIYNIGFVL